MIRLQKLNGYEIVVNPELIEWIESTPDTTLTLATGSKIIVRNSVDDVIQQVLVYRKAIVESGKGTVSQMLKTYKKEIV